MSNDKLKHIIFIGVSADRQTYSVLVVEMTPIEQTRQPLFSASCISGVAAVASTCCGGVGDPAPVGMSLFCGISPPSKTRG